MKKKLGAILLVVALVLALALPAAPVAAAALSMTVVSDTSTEVTAVNNVPVVGSQDAVYAWEPGPLYPIDGPNDAAWQANSLWDQNLTGHTFSASADWIWDSYRVVNPIAGDVIDFQKTFYIAGFPSSGTLYITADNGYEVWVNGNGAAAPGGKSAQVGAGWRTSDLTQSYVDANNWQSVESWDISGDLQPGWNTIDIYAANEQMNGATPSSNPGGLIFEIDIEYDVPDIEKVLVSSDPTLTPDTNSNGIDELPINTTTTFTMDITVTNSTPGTLTNILVQDNLGGDLWLVSTDVDIDASPVDTTWLIPTAKKNNAMSDNSNEITVWWTGKTKKVHLLWNIPGPLAPGATATLRLVVQTDINPGQGKKTPPVVEYTGAGINDLNSGATLRSAWIDGFFVVFEGLQTDPIQVESMGEEDD